MLFLASQNTLAARSVYMVDALNFQSNSPLTAKKNVCEEQFGTVCFWTFAYGLIFRHYRHNRPYVLNIMVYCYLVRKGQSPFIYAICGEKNHVSRDPCNFLCKCDIDFISHLFDKIILHSSPSGRRMNFRRIYKNIRIPFA